MGSPVAAPPPAWGALSRAQVLTLQQSAGNQAIARLLRPGAAMLSRVKIALPDGSMVPKPPDSALHVHQNQKDALKTKTITRLTYTLADGEKTVMVRTVLQANGCLPSEIDTPANKRELDLGLKPGTARLNWFSGTAPQGSWELTIESATKPVKTTQTAVPTTQNNAEKLDVHKAFAEAMKQLGVPVYLFGGAAANVAAKSPRRINDLDYRTHIVGVLEDKLLENINLAIAGTIGTTRQFDKFVRAENNKYAIDGKIDGCEITVANLMTKTAAYTVADDAIGVEDILADKALAFAIREREDKRRNDLFDLLWTMAHTSVSGQAVMTKLIDPRRAHYAKPTARKDDDPTGVQPTADSKGRSADLGHQFATTLGQMLFQASGRSKLADTLLVEFKGKEERQVYKPKLTQSLVELERCFGIPDFSVLATTRGERVQPALLVQAGNFTGDMFGVCASLVLNPYAHVVIVGNGTAKDKTASMVQFYKASKVPDEQVHILKLAETEEMSGAVGKWGGRAGAKAGERTELPYARAKPAIPAFLSSPAQQRSVSEATHQVAQEFKKDATQTRKKVRGAWDVEKHDEGLKAFLEAKQVKAGPQYTIVWSRLSGSRGGPHAQHDMGLTMLAQLLAHATGPVIVSGDRPTKPARLDKYMKLLAQHGAVDLMEFWLTGEWSSTVKSTDRSAQIALFDLLDRSGGVKHLGFRSGNLEAYAVIGHKVKYFEEEGNTQAGRMQQWSSPTSQIGYDPLILKGRMPTKKGQWVTENTKGGAEPRPPWLGIESEQERARVKSETLGPQPRERGLEEEDLKDVDAYLK